MSYPTHIQHHPSPFSAHIDPLQTIGLYSTAPILTVLCHPQAGLAPGQAKLAAEKYHDKEIRLFQGFADELRGAAQCDCVHLQLYKDLKERQKNGQTKASLSLQQYLGFESGFTLDKESNTLAILCEDVVPVLAFDTREGLIQWRVKVQHNLGSSKEFAAVIIQSPKAADIKAGPVRLHACGPRLALCANRPPEVLALWQVKLLRRFGIVDKRFCVEGGSRCGRGEGLFVFAAEGSRELTELLNMHSHEAQSRLSIASRSGSVLDKRFSDTISMDDCFHNTSMRSVSPSWGPPNSQTMHCLSGMTDLDSSLESNGEEKFRRPTSLPRCSSCIGKISHLTRSSTMNTPGSMMSPVWTMDNIIEKQCESIYTR
ncbi:PTB domain (IRS-1 type) domain-containing protein [Phthorimaea operculella]|nr:PTB domain (IRS-1 type) domain-containing protein [Phthorimaea operculella]